MTNTKKREEDILDFYISPVRNVALQFATIKKMAQEICEECILTEFQSQKYPL